MIQFYELITRLGFVGSSPPSRELNNLSRTVEQEMGLHRSKVVGQLDPMDILFDFLAIFLPFWQVEVDIKIRKPMSTWQRIPVQ